MVKETGDKNTHGQDPRRRQHGRLEVNHEFASIDAFITEYVRDLSQTGVFIRSEDPLTVGTRVDLKFTVIADEIETVQGVGVVVRAVTRGGSGPAGMGVRFESLTPDSQRVVDRLTASVKKPG